MSGALQHPRSHQSESNSESSESAIGEADECVRNIEGEDLDDDQQLDQQEESAYEDWQKGGLSFHCVGSPQGQTRLHLH